MECNTRCKETFVSVNNCECDEGYNGKKDWCYTPNCKYPYLKTFLGKKYDNVDPLQKPKNKCLDKENNPIGCNYKSDNLKLINKLF